jgi:hypothetical protein
MIFNTGRLRLCLWEKVDPGTSDESDDEKSSDDEDKLATERFLSQKDTQIMNRIMNICLYPRR